MENLRTYLLPVSVFSSMQSSESTLPIAYTEFQLLKKKKCEVQAAIASYRDRVFNSVSPFEDLLMTS